MKKGDVMKKLIMSLLAAATSFFVYMTGYTPYGAVKENLISYPSYQNDQKEVVQQIKDLSIKPKVISYNYTNNRFISEKVTQETCVEKIINSTMRNKLLIVGIKSKEGSKTSCTIDILVSSGEKYNMDELRKFNSKFMNDALKNNIMLGEDVNKLLKDVKLVTAEDIEKDKTIYSVDFYGAYRVTGTKADIVSSLELENVPITERILKLVDEMLSDTKYQKDWCMSFVRKDGLKLNLKGVRVIGNYNDMKAYTSYGLACRKNGEYIEAINIYKKAIALKPDYVEAYLGLGEAYFCKGEYNKAIESYKKAIALKPDYAEAYYSLGVIYGKLGDAGKAKEYKDKASQYQKK